VTDGYSLQQASDVLGIPKRRVRELVARGVLAGETEEDGRLRVFLGPDAGPLDDLSDGGSLIANDADEVSAPPTGPEASPFRELLNEFRNLTERYGQALLALGEARGEVAALRSRVDLLEARIDLRLPASASTVSGWEGAVSRTLEHDPGQPEEAPGPDRSDADTSPPAEAPEPGLDAESDGAGTTDGELGGSRRRRGRSSRSAVAGIAEALARADDPSATVLEELPGSADAAASAAALAEPEQIANAGLVGLPEVTPVRSQDLPSAIDLPSARDLDSSGSSPQPAAGRPWERAVPPIPHGSPYTAEFDEPDWIAEEDLAAFAIGPVDQERPLPGSGVAEISTEEQPLVAEGAGEPRTDETSETIDSVAELGTAVPAADVGSHAERDGPSVAELPVEQTAERGPDADSVVAAIEHAWEPDLDSGVEQLVEAEPVTAGTIGEDVTPADGHETADQPRLPAATEPLASRAESPAPTVARDSRDATRPAAASTPARAPRSDEIELMWLGDDDEDADDFEAELEIATPNWRPEPEAGQSAAGQAAPPMSVRAAANSPASDTPSQLAGLADAHGWDREEVEAIRNLLTEAPALAAPAQDAASIELPGATELQNALRALGIEGQQSLPAESQPELAMRPAAEAGAARPGTSASGIAVPTATDDASSRAAVSDGGAPQGNGAPPDPILTGPDFSRPWASAGAEDSESSAAEPDWLHGRRGPVANAYRRLRRVFPPR